jgi:hypothetical protein
MEEVENKQGRAEHSSLPPFCAVASMHALSLQRSPSVLLSPVLAPRSLCVFSIVTFCGARGEEEDAGRRRRRARPVCVCW